MELIERNVRDFLNELASDSPAPGGGSASALAAAMGAALVCMVGKLTVGKKRFLALPDADRARFIGATAACEATRERLTALVDEDAKSFDAVMAAYRLPKGTEAELEARRRAVEEGLRGAIAVPMRTAELCAEAIGRLDTVLAFANRSCISDLGSAAMLLSAGLAGAAMNVEINLAGLSDEEEKNGYRERVLGYLAMRAEAERIVAEIRKQ
ncbi:MAG: cyclodeaminase/cyclohydrolase family protein [Candidatus Izemoplasmatales bacterium]